MTTSNVLLLISTVFTGLMAGLFFSFSCSVMPALHRLNDQQFIAAMQSINRAIQNPVFFIVFFGVLISLPVTTWLKYSQPASLTFWCMLAGTLIYFAGTFLVTAIGNIPLNNALDKFDLAAGTKESIAAQRLLFETKWNNLNTIRTICSLLSFLCLLFACINLYEKSN